jgi:hypothetical protein
MLLNKQQLTQSLLQLVQGDYDLLTIIVTEYVQGLNDTQFDNMEEYVNSQMNELM